MSEKEKKILETITEAIPKMSEFDKGYLLGMGEAMASKKKEGGADVEVSDDKEDPLRRTKRQQASAFVCH